MKQYELSFVKCIILRDDIAEIIVNEAVEISLDMVDEIYKLLISKLTEPFSVLVNKLNHYSYSFDAQLKIGTIKELNAQAFVTYSNTNKVMTKIFADLPRDTPWNYGMFSERTEALSWLISEQEKVKVSG